MTWKEDAAEYAKDNILPGFGNGKCGIHVRTAIQDARKEQKKPWTQHAKDFGPYLTQRGYVEIEDDKTYQDGDVIIFDAVRAHTSGHIQIYYDGRWYSDHKQNNKNPWSDRKDTDTYTLYR